jgi:diguanylate cyclase
MSACAHEVTVDTAAEYLRLALPLMARHAVPATPNNYAVWYAYVCGENPALRAEIDRLVAEDSVFDAELCARLHRQYLGGQDIHNIEKVRSNLNQILYDVGNSLIEVGNDAHAFEGTLDGFVTEVAESGDLTEVRELLETLISETRQMRRATTDMQARFEARTKEIDDLQEQLQRERRRAVTDPLTGLYNRFAMLERLNAAIAEAGDERPPSVVLLDIDHFKVVNDTHGHLIGDRVIRFVAQVLKKNTKGKDTAARYGGEEFTLVLPATGPKGATAVAESVRAAVADAQLVRADNKQPLGQITLSAGVATYRGGEDPLELLNRADQALYKSKKAGRNRVTTG